jgi:hypothetical protein
MSKEYRLEILTGAKEQRIREITEYQVNIDNFATAIELIGDGPDLAEFRDQLGTLLASTRLEQRKAAIMLSAIEAQLERASDADY